MGRKKIYDPMCDIDAYHKQHSTNKPGDEISGGDSLKIHLKYTKSV